MFSTSPHESASYAALPRVAFTDPEVGAAGLTEAQAREFYAVHKDRPFYGDLVAFMTEGPCVVQVLQGENAITRNREIMGATNPEEAAEGTIRKAAGTNIERNACHGSDAPETAVQEISFFFGGAELAALVRK